MPNSGPIKRQAERLACRPETETIAIDEKGNWQFPDGSVIAKTVSVEERADDGDRERSWKHKSCIERPAVGDLTRTYGTNHKRTET